MTRRLPRLTRRRFWGAAALTGLGLGLYTWRVEPHWLEFVRRDLPIRDLPDALVGRTLAQVSDIHVGPRVDPDYLAASFRALSALNPDVVTLTGDFVSATGTERVDEAAQLLENLSRPSLGTFAVLGNHDYGAGWNNPRVADQLTKRLADVGVRVLRNQSADVSGLRLTGLEDVWGPNFDLRTVQAALAAEPPGLVLCHNPDAADVNVWGRYRGWILSGHTHGGQCKPPFLPPPLLPVANKRYTAGEFDLGDGRRLYINRGLGHLTRVRFNVRPEITLFRLVREEPT
ncbi:metallophosphoesterase [Urbifossiella limnaea]|uniref:Putative metallophosphoesterase n=1 Tax=Urbifossiella limnaea TaxID=2528023 RepID=A0A517XRE8_9BACT|nr:metallophosphoesterase [Urbifossiella limnaea]QDU20090.1 putative metallophosphoesterase [Urbifossiella limnaea]